MSLLPCMICQSEMTPHFAKDFHGGDGLGVVDYTRCDDCRFVQSETVFRMTEDEWSELNVVGHSRYQGNDFNPLDPRWLERLEAQRDVFKLLDGMKALPHERPWLDWGAGDGKLSQMLGEVGLSMKSFDAYMAKNLQFLRREDMVPGAFDLVISTSVFEHVRSVETLDQMEALVSPNGVFAIHTLVRDQAPPDPEWFYLLATHVALYSNESMRRLFRRWNYASSVYHLPSRIWFWFKDPSVDAVALAARGNEASGEETFFAARDFVAYWQ